MVSKVVKLVGLALMLLLVVPLVAATSPSASAAQIVWKYQSAVARGTYAMDLVDWWAAQNRSKISLNLTRFKNLTNPGSPPKGLKRSRQ